MIRIILIFITLLFVGSTIYHPPHLISARSPEHVTCETWLVTAWATTGISISRLALLFAYESGFDRYACHHNFDGSIDRGVGQLNSRTTPKSIDPWDYSSMVWGARMLRWGFDYFGDWPRAYTSYKWGIVGVIRHGIDWAYVHAVSP